eukprot:5713095-Prymnesium_polylepis.1
MRSVHSALAPVFSQRAAVTDPVPERALRVRPARAACVRLALEYREHVRSGLEIPVWLWPVRVSPRPLGWQL